MEEIALIVMTVAALLAIVAFLPPLARRFNVPYSVLLAILGCCLGIAIEIGGQFTLSFWDRPYVDFLRGLQELEISAQGYLWVFLPVLLFETALTLDDRALMDDLWAVLALAVVAVVVTTIVAGFALHWSSGMALVACLLLASIIATTDPVAVVAIFREVGAPKRLVSLVEGESLLNDAAAIALFAGFLAALRTGSDLSAAAMTWTFLVDFTMGTAFGLVCGRAIGWMLSRLDVGGPTEITLSVALAYLVYGVADHYLEVSGVVAVVMAGLAFGSRARAELSAGQRDGMLAVWRQLAFWASSLIFVFASLLVPDTLRGANWHELMLLGVLVTTALIARAVVLYGLLPVLRHAGLVEAVDKKHRFVMLWGGLRGALTLVLALSVSESEHVPEDIKHFVGTIATGFVLFTLLVQATTLRPLLKWLRLHMLTPFEDFVRDSALQLSHKEIVDSVQDAASDYGLDMGTAEEVKRLYAERLELLSRPVDVGDVMIREQLQSALVTLTYKENEHYVEDRARRMISRSTGERLVSDSSKLLDGLRSGGFQGYRQEARRQTGYTRTTRIASWFQRRLRWSAPLAKLLAVRGESLLVRRRVLFELSSFVDGDIAPIFGERVSDSAEKFLEARRQDVERHIEALRLQYPTFWQELGGRHLSRIAVRLEGEAYRRLEKEGLINNQVVQHLADELREKQRRFDQVPKLDLGLDTRALLARLPLFNELDENAMRALERALRAQLVLPNQRILKRGETGDSMYFIASGAIEIRLSHDKIILGTGEFFGEMALLDGAPRTADAVALSFCQLLVLRREAYQRFLKQYPDVVRAVRDVADERRLARGVRA